ncbi:MAG: hypothetical protein AAF823_03675 [Planctomycetota bacterium]
MQSKWRLICNTKNETSTRKVVSWIAKEAGARLTNLEIATYHKGGHTVSFAIDHSDMAWNDFVIEVIELGQRVAYGWLLTGSVNDDLDGSSSQPRVSGVEAIFWHLSREDSKS